MSYESQSALRTDALFTQRVVSCTNEQAFIFKDDARTQFVRLAEATLVGGGPIGTWMTLVAGAPGIKDAATQADVTDGDLLAVIQAQWGFVADLTYPTG